jgi:hypothetical protein
MADMDCFPSGDGIYTRVRLVLRQAFTVSLLPAQSVLTRRGVQLLVSAEYNLIKEIAQGREGGGG